MPWSRGVCRDWDWTASSHAGSCKHRFSIRRSVPNRRIL